LNINSKIILQLDSDNKIIKEYDCLKDVEKDNFDSSTVCKCCKGKRLTHKGFIWKYKFF
jgi:hypothetical protein